MKKRVIITGGTGLIGRKLVTRLSADYDVVVLSRSPKKYADSMPKGVELVEWDAATADGWGQLADGAHAIINLAGAGIADKRWSDERKQLIIESRQKSGEAVVAAVASAAKKPAVILQASAVGFYGGRGDEILTERSSAGEDFTATVCQAWESSTAAIDETGVRRVVMRIGIVLSQRGGALPKMMTPFNLGVGGHMGTGYQWMPWIHIDDLAEAVVYLLADPDAAGIYNLTAPAPVVNRTFTQKLAIVLKKPAIFFVPTFALRVALGEMADVVLKGQRAIPKNLVKRGFKFRFTDIETAIRDVIS